MKRRRSRTAASEPLKFLLRGESQVSSLGASRAPLAWREVSSLGASRVSLAWREVSRGVPLHYSVERVLLKLHLWLTPGQCSASNPLALVVVVVQCDIH